MTRFDEQVSLPTLIEFYREVVLLTTKNDQKLSKLIVGSTMQKESRSRCRKRCGSKYRGRRGSGKTDPPDRRRKFVIE